MKSRLPSLKTDLFSRCRCWQPIPESGCSLFSSQTQVKFTNGPQDAVEKISGNTLLILSWLPQWLDSELRFRL